MRPDANDYTKITLAYDNSRQGYSQSSESYSDWSADNTYSNYQAVIGDSTEQALRLGGYRLMYLDASTEIKPGDKLYVVYGVYNLGDSFGTENNKREHVAIFKKREQAEIFQKKLNAYNKLTDLRKNVFNNLTPTQKEHQINICKFILGENYHPVTGIFKHRGAPMYFPWGGYFERIQYIDIIEVVVSDALDIKNTLI
jgi:hypothetical protein